MVEQAVIIFINNILSSQKYLSSEMELARLAIIINNCITKFSPHKIISENIFLQIYFRMLCYEGCSEGRSRGKRWFSITISYGLFVTKYLHYSPS